jgi:hypothetical protein
MPVSTVLSILPVRTSIVDGPRRAHSVSHLREGRCGTRTGPLLLYLRVVNNLDFLVANFQWVVLRRSAGMLRFFPDVRSLRSVRDLAHHFNAAGLSREIDVKRVHRGQANSGAFWYGNGREQKSNKQKVEFEGCLGYVVKEQ